MIAIYDDLVISAVSLTKHGKTLERAKDRNIKFNVKKIQFKSTRS